MQVYTIGKKKDFHLKIRGFLNSELCVLICCLKLKKNHHQILRHLSGGVIWQIFTTLANRFSLKDISYRLSIKMHIWNSQQLPSSQGPGLHAVSQGWLRKIGIFFISGISREHASLLQSQNIVWSTWIKFFGTGTKLIVSGKYHYRWNDFHRIIQVLR